MNGKLLPDKKNHGAYRSAAGSNKLSVSDNGLEGYVGWVRYLYIVSRLEVRTTA